VPRHLALTLLFLALTVSRSRAALVPSISNDLRGQAVPAFQAETLDGKPFTTESLAGRTTLVNFFASWCPACNMLVWLTATGEAMLASRRRFLFAALAILGVWILFGGTQVGGAISHH